MWDTEERASAHHFHPLQRGGVHIVYNPAHLYNWVRCHFVNVFHDCDPSLVKTLLNVLRLYQTYSSGSITNLPSQACLGQLEIRT